jgi:hypothetical protein
MPRNNSFHRDRDRSTDSDQLFSARLFRDYNDGWSCLYSVSWNPARDPRRSGLSAMACPFGRSTQASEGIPIGLVKQALGATGIDDWLVDPYLFTPRIRFARPIHNQGGRSGTMADPAPVPPWSTTAPGRSCQWAVAVRARARAGVFCRDHPGGRPREDPR